MRSDETLYLTGPRGIDGNTGPTGATGFAGRTGATGNPGSQGPSGPEGPQGRSGRTGATGLAVRGTNTDAPAFTATCCEYLDADLTNRMMQCQVDNISNAPTLVLYKYVHSDKVWALEMLPTVYQIFSMQKACMPNYLFLCFILPNCHKTFKNSD